MPKLTIHLTISADSPEGLTRLLYDVMPSSRAAADPDRPYRLERLEVRTEDAQGDGEEVRDAGA
ncbi:MAG: hypothetical protein AB7N76_09615 [Planctomycetota bacterium]